MFFGLYFFYDFNNDSLLINDEGFPDNPHIGFPIVFFLTPGTIILQHLFFGIRNQAERQLSTTFSSTAKASGGAKSVAEVLNFVDRGTEKNIILMWGIMT